MSKPTAAIIAAMDRNRLIGDQDRLPWNRPEDLRLFRQLTEGNTVIMGRRTFESIGAPLADRCNLVISRSLTGRDKLIICRTFAEALREAWKINRPVFFIGGTAVYRKALQIVDQLHISWIEGKFEGDRYFPEFDLDDWLVIEERVYEGFRYVRYRRKD